ncbi:MAG: competence/damage-inducible protein A [Blastocatellia bacterium]|nr:competence/damage-inducible protein A [Blastocatellia bacterium]
MLTAEIIAVGSELLTPDKIDTNSLWLTERLNAVGIDVMLKTVVGDDEARLEEAIRHALKRCEVVVMTGGLGPTEDDITRRVAARALDRELEYRDEIEADLRERFRRWGREMPEINKRQAFIIEGSRVLPNPNGSAVGMLFESNGKTIVILPGPPRELKPMFDDHVFPHLLDRPGAVIARRRIIKVSGMGESAVDAAIADIYRSIEGLETSILFNKSEVEVRLAARAETEQKADAILENAAGKIAAALGPAVFSTQGESLEEVLGKLLRSRSETLSLAESCTGGMVARRITEVPGSSAYFLEGAVTYANEAKMRTLNLSPGTLERHGAVSGEAAEAMARGMRERTASDHAVSITGIAGPGGGSEEKPVGTVWIGYAGERGVRSFKLLLPGDRYLIRWRASSAALDYLRRQLLKA